MAGIGVTAVLGVVICALATTSRETSSRRVHPEHGGDIELVSLEDRVGRTSGAVAGRGPGGRTWRVAVPWRPALAVDVPGRAIVTPEDRDPVPEWLDEAPTGAPLAELPPNEACVIDSREGRLVRCFEIEGVVERWHPVEGTRLLLTSSPWRLTGIDLEHGEERFRFEPPDAARRMSLVRASSRTCVLRADDALFEIELASGAAVRVTPRDASVCVRADLVVVAVEEELRTSPLAAIAWRTVATPGPGEIVRCDTGRLEGEVSVLWRASAGPLPPAAAVSEEPSGALRPITASERVEHGLAVYVLHADGALDFAGANAHGAAQPQVVEIPGVLVGARVLCAHDSCTYAGRSASGTPLTLRLSAPE